MLAEKRQCTVHWWSIGHSRNDPSSATLVHCAVPVRPTDLSHRHTHRVVHYRHSSDRSFRSLWLEDIYSQLDRENERKGTLHRLCSEIDSIKSCSSCTNWSEGESLARFGNQCTTWINDRDCCCCCCLCLIGVLPPNVDDFIIRCSGSASSADDANWLTFRLTLFLRRFGISRLTLLC